MTTGIKIRLRNKRHDRTRDQVPVVTDAKGPDRLDVSDILGLVVRSDPEIGVILDRNTDETGDRVLRLLGKI